MVSDSTYVVNCFRDRWYVRWEANGWRNAKKQPVANADLWRPLIELVLANDVAFRWVKGHSGDRLNDLVDQLAVAAIPRADLTVDPAVLDESFGRRERSDRSGGDGPLEVGDEVVGVLEADRDAHAARA